MTTRRRMTDDRQTGKPETDDMTVPVPPDKEVKTKSQMRTWWLKTACMLALVVLSIVLMFTIGDYITDDETSQLAFGDLLRIVNYPLLALLFGVIICYILIESGKYAYLLKIYTGKFHFRTSLKTMFVGKYYDGITPLSTGGQPFQIYYLHKKDIPHGAASAIPIIRYIVSIFILSALSIALLILTPSFVSGQTVTKVILIIAWVSLGVNMTLPVILILFSIFPNPCKKVIVKIVCLLSKLHIVKRKYYVTRKLVKELSEYSDTIKLFVKNFWKFIPLVLLSVAECLLFVTIPFFVVIAIANVQPTIELAVQIACLVIISRYTALLIPTPGNTGAMELTSSLVFSTVTGIGQVIGWVVLVWRFFTYYIYLLSGIGINVFDMIRSTVKAKRNKTYS